MQKRPMATCLEAISEITTATYKLNKDNIQKMEQIYDMLPALDFKASYSIEVDTNLDGAIGTFYFHNYDLGFCPDNIHIMKALYTMCDQCEYTRDDEDEEGLVMKLTINNVATKE